jgi:hypothetical protein
LGTFLRPSPTNGIQTKGTLPAHHGEHMHLDEIGERQESLLTLGDPDDRQRSALPAM